MKLCLFVFVMLLTGLVNAQRADTIGLNYRVDSLLKISLKCLKNQEFEKGLEVNGIAEKMAIENLGKISEAYGWCSSTKGNLFLYKGDYKEAEKWFIEYNSILFQLHGEKNLSYAWGLNTLAQLYNKMGVFEKSEKLFLTSKSIIANIQGTNHPDYAWALMDLGVYYRTIGDYEKAEVLYLEAKEIREKTLGVNHPDYAWSLNNLANLYNFMSAFEKAEPYYLESIKLWEKLYGKESTNYATGINNLGLLYFNMGAFKKSEPLLLESSSLRAKLLGTENADYAGSLNNLAALYMNMDDYDKAEPYYLESKVLREKIFGKEHPEYANVIGNLGILYNLKHDFEKAESYFLECLSIWEKSVGIDHPEYASSLFNLANFYLDQNQLDKSESLFLKSLKIREKTLGPEHLDVSYSLKNLANLYIRKNQIEQSISLLEKEFIQHRSQLAKATTFLSELELAQYISKFQNEEEALGSCLYVCKDTILCERTKPLNALAYDHTLFYKGFLISEAVKLKALSESKPESKEIYLRLKKLRRRLADEYSLPINQRSEVKELEEKANSTEKELARLVAGYSQGIRQIQWKDVQKTLKKNEAAIEFVHFQYDFPKVTDSIMYVALLIKSGIQAPILIPLFEEKSMDLILQHNASRKADYVNLLYTLSDRGATSINTTKRSLYDMIWQPIEKELNGINTIYFSPTGLLHRLNLDAIPVTELETLADRYNLIELSSTRQLVFPTQIKNANNDAFLFGGITFEQDNSLKNSEPIIATRSSDKASNTSIDSTLRGENWTYLTGTEREVNAIEKIMLNTGVQTQLKKGSEATEETFKNLGANNNPSPRILHIATHGYFFNERTSSAKNRMTHDSVAIEGTAEAASSNQKILRSESEPEFKISDHPMLRSGLIMAGGNAGWQGAPTLQGKEDGILTAYEISQMNLSNTELVVLSACETGLGDIQGNEGVYGLQRAFKIAGAKYLIMSLWQVPDKQTSLLMTTFYKKWLIEKMTIPAAFHAAQKALRDVGLDPYQWAGFVLVE